MTSASPSLESGLVSYNLYGSQFPRLQAINMENAKGDGFTNYRGSTLGNLQVGSEVKSSKLRNFGRSTPKYKTELYCFCIEFMMEL